MKREKAEFFTRWGKGLFRFLMVALVFGGFSILALSCAGCNGGNKSEKKQKVSQVQKCDNALTAVEQSSTGMNLNQLNDIISNCFQYEDQVATAIEKHPVTYNYAVLLYDIKQFIEQGVSGIIGLLGAVQGHAPFQPAHVDSADAVGFVYSLFFSKILPYMEDGNKRVAILAAMDMNNVEINVSSLPIDLNVKDFLRTLGVKDEELNKISDSFKFDFKGKWDYVEVLVVGALDNGIYAIWKLLESHTLGNVTSFTSLLSDYKVDTSDPVSLAHFVAHALAKIPKLLVFEATEGKTVFAHDVRLYLDATLSYLTGRDADLTDNGVTYAVKNPGLFAAIEAEYSKDQSNNFVQYIDKDGDGKISYKDQIYLPLLEEANPNWGKINNPFKRQTWLDLVDFGKTIEDQLENYQNATPVDISSILNEVFQDLSAYAHDEYKKDISIPTVPEGIIKINAGALFKAAESDNTFKGLRSLLPAWVPNPRYDEAQCVLKTEVGNRKDVSPKTDCKVNTEKDGAKVFDYLLVAEFETYVTSPAVEYGFTGATEISSTLYYGEFTRATTDSAADQPHFDLFFDASGNPNSQFFGSSSIDTDAYLDELHSIVADTLLPTKEHDLLLYFGFQHPDFFGLLTIDASKFAELPACQNVPADQDALFNVNAVINCAILEYGTPISQLFDTLTSGL